MNKNNIIVGGVVLILVGIFGLVFWLTGKTTNVPDGKYDNLAKCLADKKITMYGAYWCSHCQSEKKGFGSSFQYVPYVECTEETQKCVDAKVSGYPTWVFPDGKRFEGAQGVEKLARESGCPIN
ncbi:MAG: VKORC1/thioredoxin domain protein [Candidatus Yanofskybacteria bacterium GW2011_GWF1_44_227]|uniref:VKORC1/thioredoxin domain protein n=1 Tax=Candidatus Yanofskybacteria bacterium GW2011_GWE2_40_11 TaxID=1619033 RepID=A0A0G0QLZ1_9BACT|nr:MAG: VKORC1/thioredoxin domain protein [Candidatus Yanofskybacteria bacterium GW2011_GWE1_40_10]KKR41123.1 MAG: VKORC1/thioredoxin domain protein [Candidatus Yanofskybacteria bacterium GW2011_GWE2_40_11]KKT15880.1 MAG: VKORC1/thioredoxin domain protein [Candidatus Yanofskybacteria bacterium GW2011_GWF2_43_596]KKT53607.1 MAG: VKORC1/thioredoxin domain protein [Candidatus Yanofskybacteria bacterium GW2011_GWF1_44_227]OGN36266.1 MAG: hypothetical protein A2241_00800 [Candidatus Yanofskybacteria